VSSRFDSRAETHYDGLMNGLFRLTSSALVVLAGASASCASREPPPAREPSPDVAELVIPLLGEADGGAATEDSVPSPASGDDRGAAAGADGVATRSDPVDGPFSLEQATAGLPGAGSLVATIATSMGDLRCRLYDDKAPLAVASFVGLARGVRPWKQVKGANEGLWVATPAFDGTTFHRVIKGFMIQGGDPKGDGTGEPGYVLPDEIWPGAKHDRAGLLCQANRGPNTNGMQFFVTDAAAPHLDTSYTVFGECAPESVVHAIAGTPTGPRDRPITPVTIHRVEVSRDAAPAPGGSGAKAPRPTGAPGKPSR
jgi:peptidyl-prolyl cis-trans isomerase A (cyclophilin A)